MDHGKPVNSAQIELGAQDVEPVDMSKDERLSLQAHHHQNEACRCERGCADDELGCRCGQLIVSMRADALA